MSDQDAPTQIPQRVTSYRCCRECGVLFIGSAKSDFCSSDCKREAKAAAKAAEQ